MNSLLLRTADIFFAHSSVKAPEKVIVEVPNTGLNNSFFKMKKIKKIILNE